MAITLEVTTQNHTLVEQDVEKPGIFQCITFQASIAVATHLAPNVVGFLNVLIHSGDNVLFEDRKKVLVEPQKNVILIETDKGFYKPGETVKFRIVNLDDDLNVIKKEYSRIWLQKIKNGCATFTVKTKTLKLEDTDSYIVVIGKRVEDGTGEYVKHSLHCRQLLWFWPFCSSLIPFEKRVEAKEVVVIPIAMRTKSIEFINLHPFYKRGLPYTGKVFCHSSESPLSNETVDVNDEETHLSFLTDKNGEVHFSLDTTSWNSTLVSLKATYKLGKDNEQNSSESYTGVEDSFHWLKPFYSESNSFLEIKARNDVMPCDQEQEVQVDYILNQNKLSSEADHINFYYLAIAKRKILFNGEKRVPILQHESTVGKKNIFANIEPKKWPVALDFSHKEKVPGSKVSLDLKAALGSPCSVQAVDKSVLLNKDNTLIANIEIFDDSFMIGGRGFPYHLEDFEAYPCLPQQSSLHKKMAAPWYQSDADVFNLFKILRMKILTNTRIKKPVSCMKPGFEKKKYIGKDSVFGKVNVTVSSVAEDSHNLCGNRIAVTPLQDLFIHNMVHVWVPWGMGRYNVDTMLDNALHCLKNVTLDKTSLYVKALMAYVFTLRKDMEMREQLLDMLEKETETEEVFVLDVETVPREWDDVRKQLDIHVSISYTGSREISNMALVEVEMLSGFIPVSSSVTASPRSIPNMNATGNAYVNDKKMLQLIPSDLRLEEEILLECPGSGINNLSFLFP
ncbi:Phc1 [Columba guinea]|nr:Phc1 [Columba guinea]